MKRCPTCNQTFSEGWLSFCTQDGTTLVDDSVSRNEPPATIMSPSPPPLTNPNQPANWTAPGVGSGGLGSGPFSQPQPMQAGWQPPPPPMGFAAPKQGLAIWSMCLGIFSITFGWCCSIGMFSSVAALITGGIALSQIKSNPDRNTGKPLALVGIILASLYLVFWVLIMALWGFGAMMGGLK
jgi:hypothetical protein